MDECECVFSHETSVARISESPRVTLPYTEEQWARIESLGHAIDGELKKGDVRLTMGGEPTFVSVDDPDGAEWIFTANAPQAPARRGACQAPEGEVRRRLAAPLWSGEMVPRRAASALGPGGLLAQGWRPDLEGRLAPCRRVEGLRPRRQGGQGTARPDCRTVGADPKCIIPAYEDAFDYAWKERRLPSNVTPEKSNLRDGLERDRIARIFQRGLGEVVGYARRSGARGPEIRPGGRWAPGSCGTTTRSGSSPATRRWGCGC